MADKTILSGQEVVAQLTKVGQAIIAARDNLNQLDALAGDGDMGISMAKGFEAVIQGLNEGYADIGRMLSSAGIRFNEAAGSTIGALMSTALMRAGKALRGKSELDMADVVTLFDTAAKGIMERGKANLGDRTLLDALIPATEALREALEAGEDPQASLKKATLAAERGVEATRGMVPLFGRARWLPERARGQRDPGAVAMHIVFKTLSEE